MSHNYENEGFDSESAGRAGSARSDDKKHHLKLSVDFLTVKDMQRPNGSISISYSLRLGGAFGTLH